MSKKKNLSRIDVEDVSTYEAENQSKLINLNGTGNKIKLEDIPIKIKCLTSKQKELKQLIESKDFIICSGPAGTGKTFFSLLMALHLLKTEPKYKKIILIKSLQVVKGEEVGFLKGELDTKLAPYHYSYTGNLDKIFGSKFITKSLMESGIIEILPIAYSRGVTLDSSIILIDETQNITMDIFKTISTRIGKDSKMIFLGDREQSDLTNKKNSCLDKILQSFKETDFVGTLEFAEEDCVRNGLIPKLLKIINEIK